MNGAEEENVGEGRERERDGGRKSYLAPGLATRVALRHVRSRCDTIPPLKPSLICALASTCFTVDSRTFESTCNVVQIDPYPANDHSVA